MKKKIINSIIYMSNIEVTMNLQQYIAYKNNKLTLADIKFVNSVDKEILNIKNNNKNLYRNIVITLACCLNTTAVAYADSFAAIDRLGYTIFSVIQNAMYWVCLISLAIEVGKCVGKMGNNGLSELLKIILKYLLCFATMYFITDLFDMIKNSF